MNDATAIQMRLIGEICDALDATGVAWWLYGGWAMDFHAGRITRDHADIELFVWREDADAARAALVGAGFLAPAGLHPDEAQPFLKDGQEVGAWYLVDGDDGSVHVPGRWEGWAFDAGWFEGPRLRMDSVEAPAMSAKGLLAMKLGFADQPAGGALRPKDLADIARLRAIMASRAEDDW
jgi:hypothetical protein